MCGKNEYLILQMVSRPDFTVEVERAEQTLVFQCSCLDDLEQAADGGSEEGDTYGERGSHFGKSKSKF